MMRTLPLVLALVGLVGCVNAVRMQERLLVQTSDFGKTNTVPFDMSLRNGAVPLSADDPRIARKVEGIAPEQVHVSYWGPGNYLVSYVTGYAQVSPSPNPSTTANSTIPSMVQYGTTSGQLTNNATGRAITYTYDYTPYGGLSYASAVIHHVLLAGLKPSTKYYYRCGIAANNGTSDERYFTTLAEGNTYPLKIAVMADVGQTPNTTQMHDHLKASEPQLLFNIADLTYADTHYTSGESQPQILQLPYSYGGPAITYQPRWDYWGRLWEDVFSYVPVLQVNGNHEIEPQPDNTTQLSYNSRYPVPQAQLTDMSFAPNSNTPGAKACFTQVNNNPKWTIDNTGSCAGGIAAKTNNMYYSVDIPGAHTIWLSSYIAGDDFSPESAQYKWLEADLQKVDRTKTPWLIVNWHAPWYNTYASHFKENECMRQSYEPLLYKYGVDISFLGHVHGYERTNPVYNYTVDECGPVHITIGDGGNSERLYTTFVDTTVPAPSFCQAPLNRTFPTYQPQRCFSFDGPNNTYCYTSQPAWSAFREPSFGFGTFTIMNETSAKWEWYRNQNSLQQVADSVVLTRNPDQCAAKRGMATMG